MSGDITVAVKISSPPPLHLQLLHARQDRYPHETGVTQKPSSQTTGLCFCLVKHPSNTKLLRTMMTAATQHQS